MDDQKKSPLERYLEKKRKEQGPAVESAPSSTQRHPQNFEAPFSADADQQRKVADQTPSVEVASSPGGQTPTLQTSSTRVHPANFGPRLIAYLLDLIAIWALATPVQSAFVTVFGFLSFGFLGPTFLERLGHLTVVFFYFGWFYSQKGASPGKIALGLRLIQTGGSEERIGYARSFFRETVGKFISMLPFSIGFIIAAFRPDGKAFHDMLFDTQVVRKG